MPGTRPHASHTRTSAAPRWLHAGRCCKWQHNYTWPCALHERAQWLEQQVCCYQSCIDAGSNETLAVLAAQHQEGPCTVPALRAHVQHLRQQISDTYTTHARHVADLLAARRAAGAAPREIQQLLQAQADSTGQALRARANTPA